MLQFLPSPFAARKTLSLLGYLFAFIALFIIPPDCRADDNLNRPFRDKWAVVIGISRFVKPELDLKYADRDAASFCEFLTSEGKFARDHVKLLTNEKATRRSILSTLGTNWLPRLAGPEDLVVIYISSHGSPSELDVEGVNYLLASDSDPDDLYSTGIDMQAFARMIKAKVQAGRIVLIMDTCYSGAGGTGASKGIQRRANVDAEKIAGSTGQIVIASSLPNQVSWECRNQPASVFTNCLLEGLKQRGGNLDLAQAFSYLKDKVQSTVLQERGELQTPIMKSPWQNNNLFVCAPAASPQAANLDDSNPEKTAVQSRDRGEIGLSKASTAVAASGERVALLPFEQGDEMGLDMPDFNGLNRLLEELVRLRLSSALGERLLSPYEVGAALGKTNLNSVWTGESRVALGKACRAGYLVKVRITKAHFDENGNLNFSVSICVASGQSGEYIWTGGNKAGAARCEGDGTARLAYLKQKVLPAFATYISRAVLAAINPK